MKELAPMLAEFRTRQFVYGSLTAIALTLGFAVWGHLNAHSLLLWSLESGPIESAQALGYGLASLGFVLVLFRSEFLKSKHSWTAFIFVLGLAFLMFFCAGEEISWGRRIFHFKTPASIAAVNAQHDFNVHNLNMMHDAEYRLVSLFMLFVGVIFPLLALGETGRRWIQKLSFPVAPLAYSAFFVCSWLFGKIYFSILLRDTASEVRELLFALGMMAFAWHGVLRPDDLFRIKRDAPTPPAS